MCTSPYHQAEDCPNQDPSRKPHRQTLVCFDFNKPSGCQSCSCLSRTIAVAVAQGTTPSSTALVPNRPEAAADQPTLAIAARNKVEQRQLDHNPTVSTPLNVDKLALELVNHPTTTTTTTTFIYTKRKLR